MTKPKDAITEATGIILPQDLTIQVHQDTPTLRHLVIPVNPYDDELSDSDLEAVAGGSFNAQLSPGVHLYSARTFFDFWSSNIH